MATAPAENAGWWDTFIQSIPGFGSLSDLGKIAVELGGFFTAITDGKMWRSLGWLALGLLLMWWGVLLWTKVPQTAAKVAAVAAAA